MILAKLKAKNQLTLPQTVVERLHLGPGGFFQLDVRGNCVLLIPVTIEPRWGADDLVAIDELVEMQKTKAKPIRPGKDFSKYIKRLTK